MLVLSPIGIWPPFRGARFTPSTSLAMIDWWNNLSLALQIFIGIGVASLGLTLLQLVLSLLGIGGDSLDIDFDLDAPDGDPSSGAGIFSLQTLSAFFLGFGWVGAMGLSSGLNLLLSVAIAIVMGLAVMFGVYTLVRQLLRLQSRGNLDYASAVGQEATVYVTLPGDDADGGGQIQLTIQGRMRVAGARKRSPGPARPGDRVRIVSMSGETTFNVEPLHSA